MTTVTLFKNGNVIGQLEAEIEAKRQEYARLTQQLYEVKTNRYVEEQARDNLGLLKDGEVAVLSARDQKTQPEKPVSPPLPNYLRWFRLFF